MLIGACGLNRTNTVFPVLVLRVGFGFSPSPVTSYPKVYGVMSQRHICIELVTNWIESARTYSAAPPRYQ